MRQAAVVFLLVLLTVTSSSQTTNLQKKAALKKPAAKSATPRPVFTCPDPEAKQGCKSYEELARAKDSGLPGKFDERYVCFRKNADEFFVVAYSTPLFQPTWNEKYKKAIVDPSATSEGSGFASTYVNGVDDSHTMPAFFFEGTWRPYEDGLFSASKFNFEDIKTTDDPHSSMYINRGQLSITYRYQNALDAGVVYSLTIQRSTGRFVESFQKLSEKVPFLQSTGRCTYQKAE